MPFPKPDLLIYNISYVFDSNSIILLRYKDCYYSLYFLGVGYFRLHCMMRRHCILELIHNPVALNCILSRDFIWISELLSCRLCPVFLHKYERMKESVHVYSHYTLKLLNNTNNQWLQSNLHSTADITADRRSAMRQWWAHSTPISKWDYSYLPTTTMTSLYNK